MKTKISLVIAVAIIVWQAAAIVRIENERYALVVGMCRDKAGLTDTQCLAKVQSRTGWWWHLAYALT